MVYEFLWGTRTWGEWRDCVVVRVSFIFDELGGLVLSLKIDFVALVYATWTTTFHFVWLW